MNSTKLKRLEQEMAALLARHSVDDVVGYHPDVIAYYLVTCIGALKTAKQQQKEREDA
jgi:hypothetical protein